MSLYVHDEDEKEMLVAFMRHVQEDIVAVRNLYYADDNGTEALNRAIEAVFDIRDGIVVDEFAANHKARAIDTLNGLGWSERAIADAFDIPERIVKMR